MPLTVPGATASEIAQDRWGGPTRIVVTNVTVTTSPIQLLGNNPKRTHWTIVNRGVTEVYTAWQNDVDPTTDIPLAPLGGFQSLDVSEDGEATGWALWAERASGSGVVRVYSVERL